MNSSPDPTITLYNTRTRKKEALPDKQNGSIGMYVCGPTVYDAPHIGNARSVVVYDVLFRLLQHHYGAANVTYVRNITDVDDKINLAATQRNITIDALTREVTALFHEDMDRLGCIAPTHEPRATQHIDHIIRMIEAIIAHGNAYVAEGHVLFDVTSPIQGDWRYGQLSGRQIEEQEAGARVEVESYKRHPGDFVLWKPASPNDDASSVFHSPWGDGRPGWHIECSAMSTHYLGENFTLHGGGADLKFPHHENEIAQSCCANPGSTYAQHWVHNGFLTVNGEKMSKSLGNFITVRDLLNQQIAGESIRFALLSTHYAKPLDWTDKLLADGEKQLKKLYKKIAATPQHDTPSPAVIAALRDDLNVPKAIAALHSEKDHGALRASGALLGCLQDVQSLSTSTSASMKPEDVEAMIAQRKAAKAEKNFAEADRLRDALLASGITLKDNPDGTTSWQTT